MGKARGPRRKIPPARKAIQTRCSSSSMKSALVNKNKRKDGRHSRSEGLAGAEGHRQTLCHEHLVPNKSTRRGKRRRRGLESVCQPGSSDSAAIQAEYAAVDARERAKERSKEALHHKQSRPMVRLAPATVALMMPSQRDASMQELRASSSARMVEALLQSISDDTTTEAPRRSTRSTGRERAVNSFSLLADDSDGSDRDDAQGFVPDFGVRHHEKQPLTFHSRTGYTGTKGGERSLGAVFTRQEQIASTITATAAEDLDL